MGAIAVPYTGCHPKIRGVNRLFELSVIFRSITTVSPKEKGAIGATMLRSAPESEAKRPLERGRRRAAQMLQPTPKNEKPNATLNANRIQSLQRFYKWTTTVHKRD